MFRNNRLQMLAVVAVSAAGGWLAASGRLSLLPRSDAAPPAAATSPTTDGSCCEGADRGRSLAKANSIPTTLVAQLPTQAATAALALAPGQADEVIFFEILVPADAVLEIEGEKTNATGEVRHFETPPLGTGSYTYTVKAAAKGKVVTKKLHLTAGSPNSFDLRSDLEAGAVAPQRTQIAAKPGTARKPNIVFIMGDDVGWFNIGAYHQGIMSGRTPNLDKLAAQGMRFTDYYAEASCTAGRANFITGEIPLRTGMTTVGQAGADVGMPAQACTIATALKAQGYATGQFGKNHLGDLNKFLPTLHGFDEFFGYLYHLDAMSDPYWYSFPSGPEFWQKHGPRNLVHCWATDTDDATEMPRWGRIGKQKVVDEGPLPPYPNMKNVPKMQDRPEKAKYDMTTFDDVLVENTCRFMDESKKAGKPFFIWHNTTRMHVWTFLGQKYAALMNERSNYGEEEAGMKQMDDSVGAIMKHLEDIGEADNTLLVFSTDNGAECFTWPDGGNTPFKGCKGMVTEGSLRVPCIARWSGKIKPGTIENGIFSGLDWFPTMVAAAGNTDITDELLKGVKLGDRTYKNHLDGYNQMDLLLGKGPSKRHELYYFGGPNLGAVRVDDMKFVFFNQPTGWPGPKVTTDMPVIVNLRQDPFERFPALDGQTSATGAWGYGNEFFGREAWRFVGAQQAVEKLALTAIDYPPMQDPASFNLEAIKSLCEKSSGGIAEPL